MGVYSRYKKDPDGLRKLVQLLESTPLDRRKRMIDVGYQEDEAFTEEALKYLFSFEDILNMPDSELCEVMAKALPRVIAMAISDLEASIQERFLRCAKPKQLGEIRDLLDQTPTAREVGGARLRMIEAAREAERGGFVRTKRIPIAA